MDQNREIRFLIPPFFLFASLLWGAHFDPAIDLTPLLKPDSAQSILGVIAAGTISVIPLGFLIGTVSVTLLRVGFWIFWRRNYEAHLPEESLKRIWPKLNSSKGFEKRDAFYAIATYDHEIIPAPIHEWIVRRWNSFNISVHSCSALLLAHGAGALLGISQGWGWWLTTGILVVVLVFNAVIAWKD